MLEEVFYDEDHHQSNPTDMLIPNGKGQNNKQDSDDDGKEKGKAD